MARHLHPELNPKQRQAIDLLVSGSSVSEVAAKLRVHRATVYRWRADPAFDSAYQDRQLDLQDQVHGVLTGRALEVAQRLADMAAGQTAASVAQVNAVRAFFELLGWHKANPVTRPARAQAIETREELVAMLGGFPRDVILEVAASVDVVADA